MASNNLSELFNQRIFRIPDYQRGYAWEEKQLTELWDDLDEIAEIDGELKRHYTGTIYLEETQPLLEEKWLSGVKFFNVVDGQQRLTSISILLFELLKVADKGYCEETREDLKKVFISKSNSTGDCTVYKFSYSQTDRNQNFLLHTIFEDDRIVLQHKQHNLYTKNLEFAKKFFRERISTLSYEQKEILFKKITTSLQFDIRTIEKDLDVQAVFETMNNRGKPLSTLEKLKNRLIYLTEKLNNNSTEDKISLRKKINDAWGKIYICLAQNSNQVLDEDEFLSAHLSLYRKPKESTFSEKIAEEKVFQMFCNKSEKFDLDENGEKEEPVSYKKIDDYIIRLSELAPIWYDIHNSKSKLINKILVLNSSKEIKILLLSVLKKAKDEQLMFSIFDNLEQILFRNRVPGIWVMDERNTATWARDIYKDEESLAGIFHKTEDLINTPVSVNHIINSFKGLFEYERGNKGFHRWGSLKYFLFEYEDFLKLEARETDDKVTLSNYGETTIEHIIPQNFWDNWQSEVNAVTDELEAEKIDKTRKVFLNTLGNLTILKNGKNSSLGNKSWIEKKDRFRTGSYNEIDICKNDSWTKEEILSRGINMLKFMETKVRGLSFSEDDALRALFYDDYIIERVTEKDSVADAIV